MSTMEMNPTFTEELDRARREWQEITRRALKAALGYYDDFPEARLSAALEITPIYLRQMIDGDRAASGEALLRLAAATKQPVVDLLLGTIDTRLIDAFESLAPE